jgi:tetratricopeptide (TPR) repeat protein
VRQAKKRLKRRNPLEHSLEYRLLTALQAGKKGLGLIDRFHYFQSIEVLQPEILLEILTLSEDETVSEDRYTQEIRRIAKRYPSLLHFAELMVWYEDQTSFGLDLLDRMATPAAYARLREFALGQLGEDEARTDALFALRDAGEIEPGETVRFWRNGAWTDLESRTIEIIEPEPVDYDPEAVALFEQSADFLSEGRFADAATLLEQAIDLDPAMTAAYNNLAITYLKLEEVEQAQALLERAIELDSEYAFAWLNLAGIHAYAHDLDAARACLNAVAAINHLSARDAAHMLAIEAQIALQEERFEDAESYLNDAAALEPDLPMIESLRAVLEQRQSLSDLRMLVGSFATEMAARNRRKRLGLQGKLTTSEPTIDDLIGLYTAEVLRKMGAVIAPDYRWSGLRKQEAKALLHTVLNNPDIVRRLTQETLAPDEQAALQTVLDEGGSMNWDAFAARFGHDLDESPHWQYHEPESIMGRLRFHGLLVETTVDGQLLVVVPQELCKLLAGS